MNRSKWRKILGSMFLASTLLLVGAASAWAQSTTPAPGVTVEVVAEPGVLIVHVMPDTPAAKAGLQRGDVVLAVNEVVVNQVNELAAAIRAAQAGDPITLTVQHGDEQQTLTVTVGERQGAPYLGVMPYSSSPLGPGDNVRIWGGPARRALPGGRVTISQTLGVRIVSVLPESPAAAAGLAEGDLIVGVNGELFTPEADLGALLQAYKPGDQVTLQVQGSASDAQATEITVTLGEQPEAPERAYLGVRVAPLVFFQVEDIQGDPSGSRVRPAPEMRRYRFVQPYNRSFPPFAPMLPHGYWFGQPEYGMEWCQPAPGDMLFMQPVPPPMLEGAPEWFSAPEIDSFEFARPIPPQQFDLPAPAEEEDSATI